MRLLQFRSLYTRRLAHLLLLLPFPFSSFAQADDGPRGIYSASGATNPAVLTHPQVRGVLLRASWSQLEPQPGVYTLQILQSQAEQVREAGREWLLAVSGSGHPEWLIDELGAPWFEITFHEQPRSIPLWWDDLVQQRLALLANALGSAFAADSSLSLVYIPQMTANGIEGHFNGVPQQTLLDAGWSEELWVDAALGTSEAFALAFPDKALAFEVHELLGSAQTAMRILDSLRTRPVFGGRAGAAIWWLSGRWDYQNSLLTSIADWEGDLYTQMIGSSDQPWRFEDGSYLSALEQARELHARSIEAWEFEFVEQTHDSAFAAFNEGFGHSTTLGIETDLPHLWLRWHPLPQADRYRVLYRVPPSEAFRLFAETADTLLDAGSLLQGRWQVHFRVRGILPSDTGE